MIKVTSRYPHQNTIKIEWNLSKRCNYDCSYCPADIHDNVSPHTDIEILKAAVDKLATLNKPLRISFTGGEPCVHPKFKELVNYTKWKTNAWINVTTNGTLPKATITVLIRSEEPVYIKTVDEKKNEENFRKTYNTSFIRTFTKDQLFEVETKSNLKQKILIKNLKTDKYRRKKGTHIIYNKIELRTA